MILFNEFTKACNNGNIKRVQELLDQGVDPSADDNDGIRSACFYGHIEVVKLLLDLDESKGIDPSADNNYGVRMACINGHTEVVKLLLDLDESRGVDPSANDNDGFQCACYGDHIEVIKLLLDLDESKGIDPSANEYYGFMELDFSDKDKELFLSFIHHPKFYPTTCDSMGILPEKVQRKVEELEKKFFGTEKGIRAKPSRRLKKIN